MVGFLPKGAPLMWNQASRPGDQPEQKPAKKAKTNWVTIKKDNYPFNLPIKIKRKPKPREGVKHPLGLEAIHIYWGGHLYDPAQRRAAFSPISIERLLKYPSLCPNRPKPIMLESETKE